MLFNYKNINSFCDYNSLENLYLRGTILKLENSSEISEVVSIARSFEKDSYFDFVRFFNLINFFFGYRKSRVRSKANSLFIYSRTFTSKFLYFLLRKLSFFQNSSKGSFIKIVYFDNGIGMVRIREPHVAFSAVSPYFDYHNSKLNLNLEFSYRSNPKFLYKLIWLFGF